MRKRVPRWVWVGTALLVIAWLFWFPPTRMVLVFLLPLGSGRDDFIVIALFAIAVFVWWTGLFTRLPDIMSWLFRRGKK